MICCSLRTFHHQVSNYWWLAINYVIPPQKSQEITRVFFSLSGALLPQPCTYSAMWDLNLNSPDPRASSDNLLSRHAICVKDKENVRCHPQAVATDSLQLTYTLLYVYSGRLEEHSCQGTPLCSRWLQMLLIMHSLEEGQQPESTLWWCQPWGTPTKNCLVSFQNVHYIHFSIILSPKHSVSVNQCW